MRFAYALLSALVIVVSATMPCPAQAPVTPVETVTDYGTSGINYYIYPEDRMRGAVDPNTGLTYQPPVEPNIPQVKFQKPPGAGSLRERIDRLVEGVTVDIPPEYDHYGYELRRYMASVGNPQVYGDPERRKAELKNVKTAQIIFEYWIAEIRKQMSQISKDIDIQNASSDIRTSFKYNTGVVNAFQMECQIWLDKNKVLLEFLDQNAAFFTFKDPYLNFRETQMLAAFKSAYDVRSRARLEINKYSPFAMMVY